MDQNAFTVKEFILAFKVGRTRTYEEITSGRLATYQVGRRRYISGHAANDWQRALESASRDGADRSARGFSRSATAPRG